MMKFGSKKKINWKGVLLGALIAAALVSPAAAANFDLFVRNVDLSDSCSGSTAFRPQFKVVNNTTAPVALSEFKVKMYFSNPTPVQFVNVDNVVILDAAGQPAGTTQAASADEILPTDPGCSPPAGGFCGCGFTPGRKANQARVLSFTGGSVPPGGSATVIVMYWRGGVAPFDAGCDDFSKLVNLNPTRPFFQDAFFSLFRNNVRVFGNGLLGSVPTCSNF
jgi:hypothetical protein